MAENRFDVLVIGGGITGVGIVLDAAARGFSVALVEKDERAGHGWPWQMVMAGGLAGS
jgi:glycerol-3-phosphate dehydrogenase